MTRPWLVYSLLTVVVWGIWAFIPRKLESVSAEQQQVLSALGLLPILLVLGLRRSRLTGKRVWRGVTTAFGAGMVGGVGNLFFYQLLHGGEGAATVVPLTSLYPLVTVVLAVLILKERMSWAQGAGIPLALAAIYFFNVGREEALTWGWLARAMIPIGLWGVAGLLQKVCTHDVSAELSTLSFLSGFLPLSAVLAVAMPMKWALSSTEWGWGLALGWFLGVGNLTLLAAFASGGKAAIVSPMAGMYSVVTVPLAVGLLQEHVRPREWIGIVLAVVAVGALSWEKPGTVENEPKVG